MTLHARHITVALGGRDILHDVSLRIDRGEMTNILGSKRDAVLAKTFP